MAKKLIFILIFFFSFSWILARRSNTHAVFSSCTTARTRSISRVPSTNNSTWLPQDGHVVWWWAVEASPVQQGPVAPPSRPSKWTLAPRSAPPQSIINSSYMNPISGGRPFLSMYNEGGCFLCLGRNRGWSRETSQVLCNKKNLGECQNNITVPGWIRWIFWHRYIRSWNVDVIEGGGG